MLNQIDRWVASQGLQVQAVFHPDREDNVPPLESGDTVGTLLLIGNAGSTMWHQFRQSPEYDDGLSDPLDRWSLRLGHRLAEEFGGSALFPFSGPPFHPFLSWAARADSFAASPLGLSIHPRYGLWHAYRFALALPQRLECLPDLQSSPSPCLSCSNKPCLDACPVNAFTGKSYLYIQCAQYLAQSPGCDCNQRGCGSRRACPVGKAYQYESDHGHFHMQAFVANHGTKEH